MNTATHQKLQIVLFPLLTVLLIVLAGSNLYSRPPSGDQNPEISAAQFVDSIMQSTEGKTQREIIATLMDFGKEYCYSDPDLSIALAEKALELAKRDSDPMLISSVINGVAFSNYVLGNNAMALELFLDAIDNAELAIDENPDSILFLGRLQSYYNNAGSLYGVLGNHEKQLEILLKASAISDTLIYLFPDNKRFISSFTKTKNNLGTLYWNLGEPDKAFAVLNEAMDLLQVHDDPENKSITLNNIGVIQIEKQQLQQAINTYQKVVELSIEMNDSVGLIYSYNNLGLIMEKMDSLEKALSYYRQAHNISSRLGFSFGLTSSCSNIAKIYSALNNPDSALRYLNMGIAEADRSGNMTLMLKSYKTLYTIYENSGNPQKALDAYKHYVMLKDSTFNAEKSKQIAEMQTRFDTEKKEKENKILRQNIQIQQRTTLLLVISLATIVGVAFLLFYLYRLKNKALKQQSKLNDQEQELHSLETARLEDQLFAGQQINKLQNEKLAHQNRELSTRILNAINKNEAMNKIILELEQLKSSGSQDIEQCYIKVNNIVKDNISLDKDWDQFKLHFEEVNPGFFHSLSKIYPGLTQNEQKLCAYYRINLDTKEIARILNITIGSVQKGRQRLRKKMNMPSDIEFPVFISRI
jgi:tetratricopeptide (TPR) repeat protein/DNA-binding CsgD family transcriptional regulator